MAQRLGFRWDESLSLGKALAGLNAQSKDRRLGIFEPHEEKAKVARERLPRDLHSLVNRRRRAYTFADLMLRPISRGFARIIPSPETAA